MNIAVTGATGTVGKAIVDRLVAAGLGVRALRRPRSGRLSPDRSGVTWVDGDVRSDADLDALVEDAAAIIHAAYTQMDEAPPDGESAADHFVDANCTATLRLLSRTGRTGLGQFVYVSSLAVYGAEPHRLPAAGERPLDEDLAAWPREFYGAHKAAMEKMVAAAAGAFGLNTSAFRLGTVIGDYADRGRDPLWPIVDEAVADGEIRTSKAGYVIAAEDAAAILVDAVGDASVAGRVYNTFHRWMDFTELAEPLGEILGRNVRVSASPQPAPSPALDRSRLDERAPTWRTKELVRARLRALAGGD